jgi:hypothetical protein
MDCFLLLLRERLFALTEEELFRFICHPYAPVNQQGNPPSCEHGPHNEHYPK